MGSLEPQTLIVHFCEREGVQTFRGPGPPGHVLKALRYFSGYGYQFSHPCFPFDRKSLIYMGRISRVISLPTFVGSQKYCKNSHKLQKIYIHWVSRMGPLPLRNVTVLPFFRRRGARAPAWRLLSLVVQGSHLSARAT